MTSQVSRFVILGMSCLLVSACQEIEESNRAQRAATARSEALDRAIKEHGYAQVGQMPGGEPLLMRYGEEGDRIYFTDHAITAHEYCGKNCSKDVVGIRR